MAEPILAQYRGTPLEAEFAQAFGRLTGSLPASVRERLAPVLRRISVKPAVPSNANADIFRTLLRATLEQQRLELTYFSAHRGVTSVRLVDPYALRSVDGRWYLLGYCHQRSRVLSFLVLRIWAAGRVGKRFVVPADFDAESHLRGALGIFLAPADGEEPTRCFDAVLRFDAFAARHVREMEWHASQQSRALGDGGLELQLTLESTVELERFVLEWGEHVEVVEPVELRERIAARLALALQRYREPPNQSQPRGPAGERDRDTR